jgi:hypothetical protein
MALSISLAPFIKWIRDHYLESVTTALGPEAFEAARTEGRTMTTAGAIAYARQQAVLLP